MNGASSTPSPLFPRERKPNRGLSTLRAFDTVMMLSREGEGEMERRAKPNSAKEAETSKLRLSATSGLARRWIFFLFPSFPLAHPAVTVITLVGKQKQNGISASPTDTQGMASPARASPVKWTLESSPI